MPPTTLNSEEPSILPYVETIYELTHGTLTRLEA